MVSLELRRFDAVRLRDELGMMVTLSCVTTFHAANDELAGDDSATPSFVAVLFLRYKVFSQRIGL